MGGMGGGGSGGRAGGWPGDSPGGAGVHMVDMYHTVHCEKGRT